MVGGADGGAQLGVPLVEQVSLEQRRRGEPGGDQADGDECDEQRDERDPQGNPAEPRLGASAAASGCQAHVPRGSRKV